METARRWRLDGSNTRVAFRVQWFGVVRVSGVFPVVHGDLALPAGDDQEADFEMTVDSAAVQTGIALRDHHLRGPRFLDGAAHPAIHCAGRATRDGAGWRLRGILSFRGRERVLSLAVPDEPPRDGRQRLAVAFRVPRREFGVGAASGLRRLNPLLWAIADDVIVEVALAVPATLLQPGAAPARAR